MTLAWQILITYAAVAGWTFVISYTVLAPWWRSAVGWNLMTMSFGLTVAFTLLAVRAWVGSLGLVVWFIAVGLIVASLTQRTVLLFVGHRRAKKRS